MDKVIVAAVSENGVIGKDGELPWHYPEDMEHFKQLTMGHPVVMGRKTFDSLPESFRPLPGRTNIVLTRSGVDSEEVEEAESIEQAWEIASEFDSKAFIIGGASVYEQVLPEADKIVLTRIHEEYKGDTYFPDWDVEDWKEVERDDRGELSFITYVRS